MKKILALALVAVMVMTLCGLAFADTPAATNPLSEQNTLTIEGLEPGDTVKFYKVLEWDQAQAEDTTQGWKYTSAFSGMSNADDIYTRIMNKTINGADAAKIEAQARTSSASVAKEDTADSTGKCEVTLDAAEKAGLYMAVITSNTAGVFYNPVFVSSNFYRENGPAAVPSENAFTVVENTNSYSDNSYAKKTVIDLTKTAKSVDTSDTTNFSHDVGDEIEFTVKTHVPKYAENYTNPVFKITDALTGLKISRTDVTVYTSDPTGSSPTTLDSANYSVSGNTEGSEELTVNFLKSYTQGDDIPASGQEVWIVYYAKVSDDATKVINQENNTVDLIFSTEPTDTKGKGLLRDETNHFTFSIDAQINGPTGNVSTEAIKIGISEDGTIIESEQTYFHGGTHAALEGAVFALYTDNGEGTGPSNTLYTNSKDGTTLFDGYVTSDANGRLNIKGLDQGIYWLVEQSAPKGYIKSTTPVKVEIKADISTLETVVIEESGTNGEDDPVTVTYKTNKLNSYSVTVGGKTTTYTIVNNSEKVDSITRSEVDSSDRELANVKGTELPSTGGIGTTIFYVTGLLMVLGAATILVARRRADAE